MYYEYDGVFSADGRFMAYESFETGQLEVFVQRFPGPGEKWQISTEGGKDPRWNPRGGELFYRKGNQWMTVDIDTEPKFQAGKPRLLFEAVFMDGYDVAPDGQRFLMVDPRREAQSTQINVVLNWLDELKRLVPVD